MGLPLLTVAPLIGAALAGGRAATLITSEVPMSELQPAVPLSELKEGEVKAAKVGNRQVALYLVDGQPYCTDDLCTHEDCLFSEVGVVEGDEVECACHGSRFNIKTGENTAPPAADPLPTFPVVVRDDQVFVELG